MAIKGLSDLDFNTHSPQNTREGKTTLDYDTLIHLVGAFEEFVIPVKKMYNEELDECYNEGVESCIEFMKSILDEVHKSENAEWEKAKNQNQS